MVTQANLRWKRLRHYLTAEPGRFAGGSALSEPLGLLAVERERLAAPQDTPRATGHAAGTRVAARLYPGATGRPPARS